MQNKQLWKYLRIFEGYTIQKISTMISPLQATVQKYGDKLNGTIDVFTM